MALGNPDRPVGGLAVPTPPGVELRPLGRDDFADALSLVRELYALRDTDAEPHRPRYEAYVNDPDASPFLALADGQPVGLICFRFRRRLNHATFEGWVSDLYVREPHRGKGIGRALLNAAIAEWRLRGGHQVMLEVVYDAVAARALYESSGFGDRGKFFEIGPVTTRDVGAAPGVEVRPVADSDADFEATTRLLAELGRPTPTEEKMPALRRVYAQHVVRADTGSLVAFADGTPVGFASLEFREPFAGRAPQGWIPDLVVTEGARGRKIGAVLLNEAFAEGQRRGAYAVALESGHQRTVAHELYRTAGMSDVGSFYTLTR